MPVFKNKLDELLADFVLSSGIQRTILLNQVRNYLNVKPTDQLRTEISEITSIQELTALQAAGVDKSLQDIFLRTLAKQGNLTGAF